MWPDRYWPERFWNDHYWAAGGTTPVVGPTITTTTLANGTVGNSYSQTLTATGGVLPYVWTVDSGSLPNGLTLHAATGVIDGTPTLAGLYSFTIKVTDDDANEDTQPFSVVIFDAPAGGQSPAASRYRYRYRVTDVIR